MIGHHRLNKWIVAIAYVISDVQLFALAQNPSSPPPPAPLPPIESQQGVTPPQNRQLADLKTRIEEGYTILPVQNGVVLSPKRSGPILSIEISNNTIAVNGTEVTGGELRGRLGPDAEMILRLSYLSPQERQA